jgi:hypothetical protein
MVDLVFQIGGSLAPPAMKHAMAAFIVTYRFLAD